MKTVANSNYIMSKDIPPCETASQGEVIVFCSEDAYAGNIKSEADLLGDLPMDESNPTAGPVFIEGAHVGDTLAVKIEKIEMEYIAADPQAEITPSNVDVFKTCTETVEGNVIRLPAAAVAGIEITLKA